MTYPTASAPTLEDFCVEARAWLASRLARRAGSDDGWGVGSESVALFHDLSVEEEGALIAAARRWQREKSDAGYGSLAWAPEHGGRGLPGSFARAFALIEDEFEAPPTHEAIGITLDLVGPTIREWGTEEQRSRFLRPLRRTDELWCQLFSEPEAGSDLASLSTRAERVGTGWVLTGQKVWTSGALHADWAYVIARTAPGLPRHAGLTAFLVPLGAGGIEVRPIRQMTGGSSFNEVFLDGVHVDDGLRLGGIGDGWAVVRTTLGFERASSADDGVGRRWERVRQLAEHVGDADPATRQRLAALYARSCVLRWTNRRLAERLAEGEVPGPEGSLGKLAWTQTLQATSDVVSSLLGPRLVAHTSEWGTFAWADLVTGAPGYRVAGGSDEIQRSIIAERLLGLPRDLTET